MCIQAAVLGYIYTYNCFDHVTAKAVSNTGTPDRFALQGRCQSQVGREHDVVVDPQRGDFAGDWDGMAAASTGPTGVFTFAHTHTLIEAPRACSESLRGESASGRDGMTAAPTGPTGVLCTKL